MSRKNKRSAYSGFGSKSWEGWLPKRETSTVSFDKDFKVRISKALYVKLFSFAKSSSLEVSGLGLVRKVSNGFEIYDVFVLEQESSAGGTTLDTDAISKLMVKLIKEKKNVGDLRFWWHTHPNFGTFWSGTDDDTCERLSNDDFLIAWVMNHSHNVRCRIDLKKPFRFILDNVPIEVVGGVVRELDNRFVREGERKVKGYVWPEYYKDNEPKYQLPLLGQDNRPGGQTLFVNSRTKQSSYDRRVVDFKKSNLYSRVTISVGEYTLVTRTIDYKNFTKIGSLKIYDKTPGVILRKEVDENKVVVCLDTGRCVRVKIDDLVG